ncbi:aspartate aminotransferase family protein [Bailinhaonella thermotolerans]|uniref:aspartate aminotransferase family protein n=1 Tax=Bailinhaonella thermotolerans TaxID=1070861 RepID=UPI00192A1A62|nr:aspartate aminotransferase family protein [Bailinhaonella thermotolerans]
MHNEPPQGYYHQPSNLLVDHGKGVHFWDSDGNRYIDCASGTFNLHLGYSHPEITRAIREQAERVLHVTSSFQSGPVNDLVENLVRVSPENLTRVHLKSSGGSEAVEGAVKIAQQATGRDEVISFYRSHHGQTLNMIEASGNAFRRKPFRGGQPHGYYKAPDPYSLRRVFPGKSDEELGQYALALLEEHIEYATSDRIAAILIEPITGNGGNVVQPRGFLRGLRKLCDERGIVLVYDEIQTGLGRTGHMFGADHAGVYPDMITVAKGLGGGLPIAAILCEERLLGLGPNDHSFTFGANVLAASVANVILEVISRPEFLPRVRRVGDYVEQRLRALAERHSRNVAEVRGAGLMWGLELTADSPQDAVDLTNTLAHDGLGHGLFLRTSRYGYGNVLKVRPPLVMTLGEATEMCDRLDELFEETV